MSLSRRRARVLNAADRAPWQGYLRSVSAEPGRAVAAPARAHKTQPPPPRGPRSACDSAAAAAAALATGVSGRVLTSATVVAATAVIAAATAVVAAALGIRPDGGAAPAAESVAQRAPSGESARVARAPPSVRCPRQMQSYAGRGPNSHGTSGGDGTEPAIADQAAA